MGNIAIAAILIMGAAVEGVIIIRARRRADYEEAVENRLARYAGQGARLEVENG